MSKRVVAQEGKIELIVADGASDIDIGADGTLAGTVNMGQRVTVDNNGVIVLTDPTATYSWTLTPNSNSSFDFSASDPGNNEWGIYFDTVEVGVYDWAVAAPSQPPIEADGAFEGGFTIWSQYNPLSYSIGAFTFYGDADLYVEDYIRGGSMWLSARNDAGTSKYVQLDPDAETFHLQDGLSLFIEEQAAANATILNSGQVWVQTGAPNTLIFTDDAGTDVVIGSAAATVNATGTPADNQVAVWTGTNTLEGDANFTWTGTTLAIAGAGAQLLLPLENDAVTPTLAFGDGDTGFYESSDDNLSISVLGTVRWNFNTNKLSANTATGGVNITDSAGSDGLPVYSFTNDLDTGMWRPAVDTISMVAGGKPMIDIVETGVATTDQVIISPGIVGGAAGATPTLAFGDGDSGFYENADDELSIAVAGARQWYYSGVSFRGNAADSPALENVTPTNTDPNIIPNRNDLNTGIGWAAADTLSLVAGGAELLRLDQPNDRFVAYAPVFMQEQASANADVANYGQLWVRSDAPNTLMYTDDTGLDFTANNVLEIEYAYSSATAVADPGAGTLRFDTVTIGSITEMYIDDLDNTGRDNSIMLANLVVGDIITFRSATDPADYIVASVSAATTDNAGYWTVPLTLIHTGTIFTDTDLLRINVEWAGSAVPPNGITGTVSNDQVVIGTGTNTVDSSANLTYNGTTLTMAGAGAQLLLPLENDDATPTLAFGDGDSGFYEEGDDVIAISVAGTRTYLYNSTAYASVTTSGFYLDATASSSTNPAFSFQGDTDTGVGRAGADELSLITGAVEAKRLQAATLQTGNDTQQEIISISVPSGTTFGYRINIVGNEAATGDTVFESIFGAIHNQAGTTAIVGSDIVDRTDDAGATGWVVTVAADDTTDALTVDVTGEAAHTIDWKVSVEILEV